MAAEESPIDRLAAWREQPDVLERLRTDPETKVLLVHRGQTPTGTSAPESIRYFTAGELADFDPQWALLAQLADQTVVLLAALAPDAAREDISPSWAGVRELTPVLSSQESELLVTAVALAAWISDSSFCPRCGAPTEIRQAGWSRRCTGCGSEHFPRTDPAVIVAVESADGERLLLGANAIWRGEMYSCFAGFVEAGESLETTVHREIEEEAGVRLRQLSYRGSQAWPYPRSLMLGFRATVADESTARGDGEEIIDVRWFTREEIGTALAGEGPVKVPGTASIAARLIREWYEEKA